MTGDHAARITEHQVRELAARVLPPRQLQAWRLHAGGCGYERIGKILGISKTGARYLVQTATRNLLAALDTKEP